MKARQGKKLEIVPKHILEDAEVKLGKSSSFLKSPERLLKIQCFSFRPGKERKPLFPYCFVVLLEERFILNPQGQPMDFTGSRLHDRLKRNKIRRIWTFLGWFVERSVRLARERDGKVAQKAGLL